jgi:hypothetical protein
MDFFAGCRSPGRLNVADTASRSTLRLRRPGSVDVGVFIALPSRGLGEEARYNIISIVTDDQARWSLGCYGNRDSRTPNMDRLAQQGARFLNAFVVTPVCSPSRQGG